MSRASSQVKCQGVDLLHFHLARYIDKKIQKIQNSYILDE